MQTTNASNANPLYHALSICESMQERLSEDLYSELDPQQVLVEVQKIHQSLLRHLSEQAPEPLA